MEKEVSDDSYCTTDEGENENEQFDEDEERKKMFTENPGDIIELNEISPGITKHIIKIGEGLYKPSDIDTVTVTVDLIDPNTKEAITNLFNKAEIEMESHKLGKVFEGVIASMRAGEESLAFIPTKKLTKFFKNITLDTSASIQEAFKNETTCLKIILHSFNVIQNLLGNEIRKKVIRIGTSWIYPRNPDYVKYSIKCLYRDTLLYEKINEEIEIDQANIYEIEARILKNIRLNEYSEVCVKHSYIKDKNKEILKDYSIEGEDDLIFFCEVHFIDRFDYVFKKDAEIYSKKQELVKGVVNQNPDRESIVRIACLIKVEGKTVFNSLLKIGDENADKESIKEELLNDFEYLNWKRKFLNQKSLGNNSNKADHQVENEDDHNEAYNDFTDKDAFKAAEEIFPNLMSIDMRLYNLPIILRKVLIHMKVNELAYIQTNFIDYFQYNDFELKQLDFNKTKKIEIYVKLFDFLERGIFSHLTFEEKFNDLNFMKEKANSFFKENKLFRAAKIYQNINYRFNFGDVYGLKNNNSTKVDEIEECDKEILRKLDELRLASHNNLSSVKFKLGSFESAYQVSLKVLKDFDGSNEKALFIHGFSCLKLKRNEEAIKVFEKMNQLHPDNEGYKNYLDEARQSFIKEQNDKKRLFKKMIFSENN